MFEKYKNFILESSKVLGAAAVIYGIAWTPLTWAMDAMVNSVVGERIATLEKQSEDIGKATADIQTKFEAYSTQQTTDLREMKFQQEALSRQFQILIQQLQQQNINRGLFVPAAPSSP